MARPEWVTYSDEEIEEIKDIIKILSGTVK